MEPTNQKPFAKRSFGQNFLADPHFLDKIIKSVDPKPDEIIVEIGAGRGALTESLLERAGFVLAIELDRDLIPVLREEFQAADNFQLVEQDALKIDFHDLISSIPKSVIPSPRSVRLVANLPYYISTAILQNLIGQRTVFADLTLMFQREVADRIMAPPGDKNRGFLTVLVEAYLESEKLFDVPPTAFRPVPKVWSTVVRLVPRAEGAACIADVKLFRQLISTGFAQKRKTLSNNLKKSDGKLGELLESFGDIGTLLQSAGIEPRQRAESLTLENWRNLCEAVAQAASLP